MAYNNAPLIKSITRQAPPGDSTMTLLPSAPEVPNAHSVEPSCLVLPTALPLTKELELEARRASVAELERQTQELERERQLAEALMECHHEEERREVMDTQGSWVKLIAGKRRSKQKISESAEQEGKTKGFDRPPDAFELYAAIDKKDIGYIMRVRDHAFPLLLQKNAGEFPIVYASRIGKSHQDIAVLICGALSRYVNHLEENDFQKKETLGVLRQLRLNLKLAIDNSLLPASDPSLLSSYLQVLIMSEGDIWLHKAVHEVTLAIRLSSFITGAPGLEASQGPVARADSMMREFCTKELRNVQGGAFGVEAYIANATMDLVIMATWALMIEQIPDAEPLPTYTFARDQRTYTTFAEATETYRSQLNQKTPKRLKALRDRLIEVCGDTHITIKARVVRLKAEIDGVVELKNGP